MIEVKGTFIVTCAAPNGSTACDHRMEAELSVKASIRQEGKRRETLSCLHRVGAGLRHEVCEVEGGWSDVDPRF